MSKFDLFCPNDSQLWIDRVCRVNLAFNSTVCDNLDSNPAFQDFENQVQQQVAEFNIIGSYIENVPTIFISHYLGIYPRSWVRSPLSVNISLRIVRSKSNYVA